MFESPINLQEQILGFEGLREIAVRSLAHGFHGALNASMRSQNDHRNIRSDSMYFAHQSDPVSVSKH